MAGGSELAVVVGGGNFFRGNRSTEWDIDRVAADQVGMLATVMNGICSVTGSVVIRMPRRPCFQLFPLTLL
jgi:uridylate kinase